MRTTGSIKSSFQIPLKLTTEKQIFAQAWRAASQVCEWKTESGDTQLLAAVGSCGSRLLFTWRRHAGGVESLQLHRPNGQETEQNGSSER